MNLDAAPEGDGFIGVSLYAYGVQHRERARAKRTRYRGVGGRARDRDGGSAERRTPSPLLVVEEWRWAFLDFLTRSHHL